MHLIRDNSKAEIFDNKGWLKSFPINDAHTTYLKSVGVKIGSKESLSAGINRPTYALNYKNDEILMLQYYGQPKIISKDGSIVGTIDIPYDSKFLNDGMAYVTGGDYLETNSLFTSSERLVVASYGAHLIRAYTNVNGKFKLDFTIGTPSTYDDDFTTTGLLRYPKDVKWLPNGNILVSVSYGRTSGEINRGHVSEFDGTSGAFIRTWLQNTTNGIKSAIGGNECRRPGNMCHDPLDSNAIYIVEVDGYKILKIDLTTRLIVEEYYPPANIRGYNIQAMGIIDNGKTLVFSNDRYKLIAMDIETREIVWIKDANNDDFSASHSGNFTYTNILEIDDKRFIVSDWERNRMLFDTKINEYFIQYKPAFFDTTVWRVDKMEGVVGTPDYSTFSTLVNPKDLHRVSEVHAILTRI